MAVANVIPLRTDGDELHRVKPGEYTAVYVGHRASSIFQTSKLRVDFRLLEHVEIVLPRWYRIKDYRGGRIRSDAHGDLVRELSAALGRRIRSDRVAVTLLTSLLVRVNVRDVVIDRRQNALAEMNQYSVIDRVIGPA